MNIVWSLLRILYAGTMSVYPRVGMFGSGIVQSLQACHRLGCHFGLINPGNKTINPGPVNDQGAYSWWQDAAVIFRNLSPLLQRFMSGAKA